jgi:hypothetical protein
MASRWIVKRGEKEGGPFTSPELRGLADSGQLRRTDLVTRQGSDRFVKAEEVKGLSFPPASEELEPGIVKIVEDEEPVIVIDAVDDSSEEPAILIDPAEEPVILIDAVDDPVDEPVVVIDADDDPLDEPVFVIDSVEKPAIVDYDYDAEDDFEEPEPAPRRRSNSRTTVVPDRNSGSRQPTRREPISRRPYRAEASEGEKVGSAAWMHLFAGVGSIAMCIGFISIADDGRGGRFTFVAAFLALALHFFYQSIKRFAKL